MRITTQWASALTIFIGVPVLAQAPQSPAVKAITPPAPIRLSLAPTGNEVRFVVQEQLAGADLPNEAIGSTSAITGGILLDATGKVDPAGSRITIDLTTLKSDRDRRDGFIKRRTIVTDSFPNAEFVLTEVHGLPAGFPTSGPLTLTLVGDMTVHGVTKQQSWQASASVNGSAITGKAVTHIKFGDYGMTQPRVAIVLSVVDDIRLEYDFHLVREPPATP
jgi:polyisoprenoid-binding protein YceI